MKTLLSFALWFALAGAALAQNVVVRAGEHGTFTRIVLQVPAGMDWTLGRTDRGYGLRLSERVDYETAEFFNLIPKTRIGAIQVVDDGAQVNFDLNCLCRAAAYLTETRWLVIDVSSGNPDPASPFEQALFAVDPPDAIRVERISAPEPTPRVELPLVVTSEATSPNLGDDAFRARAEQEERLAQLESAVGASLQRALGQGLLEPTDGNQSAQVPDELTEVDQLLLDVARLRGPGVTARTSVDRGLGDNAVALSIGPEDHQCGAAGQLDIASWGNDDTFAMQVSEKRNGLTGEFDRPDPDAIEDLARLYLFFGFGREAIATLRIDGVQSAERQTLINVAQVMDQDPVKDEGFVANITCPEPMNFWALLAHFDGALPAPIDKDSIAQTFWNLPEHLQTYLAPRVAQKLRQFGDEETALIILGAAVEQPEASLEALVEQSQLLLATGREPEAIAALETLSKGNVRTSAATLLQLLDLKIQNDGIVTDDDLNTLQTLLFENTDPMLVAQLNFMEARVRYHREEYFEALAILDENRGILDNADRTELSTKVHQGITATTTDVAFLDFVIAGGFQGQDAEVENDAAARLLNLGFAELAAPLVQNQTVGETMAERRYLRAEIAIQQNQAQLALAHLSGIQTERADAFRDRIGSANGGVDSSNEAAWRSGNWDQLTEADDDLLRQTAERVASEPSDPLATPSPLEASEALIADSTDLRATIATLLGRFETP